MKVTAFPSLSYLLQSCSDVKPAKAWLHRINVMLTFYSSDTTQKHDYGVPCLQSAFVPMSWNKAAREA